MLGVPRSHFMVILIPQDSTYGEHRLARDKKISMFGIKNVWSDIRFISLKRKMNF